MVCDPQAFYPFADLVIGGLQDLSEIPLVEQFLRSVVLHDEISMDAEPFANGSEDDEEELWAPEDRARGYRSVIVAIAPDVSRYELFSNDYRNQPAPDLEIAPHLHDLASEFSNAQPGNVYYEAHIDYLRRMFRVVLEGGSVLCQGPFAQSAIEKTTEFPSDLMKSLDQGWAEYAREIHDEKIGLRIPPVLAIVLNRCAKREAIPRVVRDLREEWAVPRRKVWQAVRALRDARTLSEANDIRKELELASNEFLPSAKSQGTSPLRVLWNLCLYGAGGIAVAKLSGGNPILGGVTAAAGKGLALLTEKLENISKVFGLGAFDLANRVSKELGKVDPIPELLSRFLTDKEKKALGY